MAGILDYLDWRGDVTFDQSPFNEVDNYICCTLSCPDYTGIVPAAGEVSLPQAARAYFAGRGEQSDRLGLLVTPYALELLRRIQTVPRYAEVRLCDYINHVDQGRNEQFAALTLLFPDQSRYVAFRGTDDTIVAWKEDFLLGVDDVIQAQTDAALYLLAQAVRREGPMMVGGHSKGGNLAVWSAWKAPAPVKERITLVWNNDGPGFRKDISQTPEYLALQPKLRTLVSQHSTVGRILNDETECDIVKSNKAGLAAHDGFNWEVLGTRFVRSQDFALASKAFDNAFKQIEEEMDLAQRRTFINALFDLLGETGAVTLTDLTEQKLRRVLEMGVEMYKNPDVRGFAQNMLNAMVRETLNEVREKSAEKLPRIHLKREQERK